MQTALDLLIPRLAVSEKNAGRALARSRVRRRSWSAGVRRSRRGGSTRRPGQCASGRHAPRRDEARVGACSGAEVARRDGDGRTARAGDVFELRPPGSPSSARRSAHTVRRRAGCDLEAARAAPRALGAGRGEQAAARRASWGATRAARRRRRRAGREDLLGLGVLEDPAERRRPRRRGAPTGRRRTRSARGPRRRGCGRPTGRGSSASASTAGHREVLQDRRRGAGPRELERRLRLGDARRRARSTGCDSQQLAQPVADRLAVVDDQRPHSGGTRCGRPCVARGQRPSKLSGLPATLRRVASAVGPTTDVGPTTGETSSNVQAFSRSSRSCARTAAALGRDVGLEALEQLGPARLASRSRRRTRSSAVSMSPPSRGRSPDQKISSWLPGASSRRACSARPPRRGALRPTRLVASLARR
jgi:hypothetical protein